MSSCHVYMLRIAHCTVDWKGLSTPGPLVKSFHILCHLRTFSHKCWCLKTWFFVPSKQVLYATKLLPFLSAFVPLWKRNEGTCNFIIQGEPPWMRRISEASPATRTLCWSPQLCPPERSQASSQLTSTAGEVHLAGGHRDAIAPS